MTQKGPDTIRYRAGFAPIIILIVASLVIGLALVILYHRETYQFLDLPKKSDTLNPTESAILNEQLTQKNLNQTANWETYKNLEHKFEIKYPRNWYVSNVSDDYSTRIIVISNFDMESMPSNLQDEALLTFNTRTLSKRYASTKLWFNDFMSTINKEIKLIGIPTVQPKYVKDITIDGKSAIKTDLPSPAGRGVSYFVINNSNLFEVTLDLPSKDVNIEKTADQILSTFHFTK